MPQNYNSPFNLDQYGQDTTGMPAPKQGTDWKSLLTNPALLNMLGGLLTNKIGGGYAGQGYVHGMQQIQENQQNWQQINQQQQQIDMRKEESQLAKNRDKRAEEEARNARLAQLLQEAAKAKMDPATFDQVLQSIPDLTPNERSTAKTQHEAFYKRLVPMQMPQSLPPAQQTQLRREALPSVPLGTPEELGKFQVRQSNLATQQQTRLSDEARIQEIQFNQQQKERTDAERIIPIRLARFVVAEGKNPDIINKAKASYPEIVKGYEKYVDPETFLGMVQKAQFSHLAEEQKMSEVRAGIQKNFAQTNLANAQTQNVGKPTEAAKIDPVLQRQYMASLQNLDETDFTLGRIRKYASPANVGAKASVKTILETVATQFTGSSITGEVAADNQERQGMTGTPYEKPINPQDFDIRTVSKLQFLLNTLAYQRAKALDPSGRVSDLDYQAAKAAITGLAGGNYDTLMSTLNEYTEYNAFKKASIEKRLSQLGSTGFGATQPATGKPRVTKDKNGRYVVTLGQ